VKRAINVIGNCHEKAAGLGVATTRPRLTKIKTEL